MCPKLTLLGNLLAIVNFVFSKALYLSILKIILDWELNFSYRQCLPGSLSTKKAKGKIVFCLRGNGTRVGKGEEVKRAGGVGLVLANSPANGADIEVDPHVLPATAVNSDNAIKILKYINSTKEPMAYIVPAKTVLYSKPAPSTATFTSRGPNSVTPDILKVMCVSSILSMDRKHAQITHKCGTTILCICFLLCLFILVVFLYFCSLILQLQGLIY